MSAANPVDLCGLCGADHEGQCPGTEPPAPFVDTRPRYPYRLPDGRVVPVIHDHDERPRPTITYDNGRGDIAEGVLVVAEHATRPARDRTGTGDDRMARITDDDVRRTGALIALLWAWSDAAEAGALRGASLQIFGDEAAETLETWAASRGATVERRTLTPSDALSNGVTQWTIVSVSMPGSASITAHRGLWT